MRNTELFQIRDTVGNSMVGPIITAYHQAAAIRHFVDLMKDPTTTLAAHPEDFELLAIGYQDEISGNIDPMTPKAVITGKQWVESQKRNRQVPTPEETGDELLAPVV